MAYPTVSAPYGLVPVNLIGGQPYSGALREMPIASGYGTAIFKGDVVKRANDGTIQKDTGTAACTPIGIFMGVKYTNSDGEQVFRNNWVASTVTADAKALVADDPDLVMKAALVSTGTTVAGYGLTIVGNNAELEQNAGSAVNGQSKIAIDGASVATTDTLPVRIIDVVEETKDSSGNYTECLVKWNEPSYAGTGTGTITVTVTGGHFYRNPTGV